MLFECNWISFKYKKSHTSWNITWLFLVLIAHRHSLKSSELFSYIFKTAVIAICAHLLTFEGGFIWGGGVTQPI